MDTTSAPDMPAIRPTRPGAPRAREDVLAQLHDVVEFFRRYEPQSPVAYMAEKALYWANMPLHVWLRDVVKDVGLLTQLEDMLGVKLARQAS